MNDVTGSTKNHQSGIKSLGEWLMEKFSYIAPRFPAAL